MNIELLFILPLSALMFLCLAWACYSSYRDSKLDILKYEDEKIAKAHDDKLFFVIYLDDDEFIILPIENVKSVCYNKKEELLVDRGVDEGVLTINSPVRFCFQDASSIGFRK